MSPRRPTLNHIPLDLLRLADVDVLHHQDEHDAQRQHRRPRNRQQALRIAVSRDDGVAHGRSDGVRQLRRQAAVQRRGEALALGRQMRRERRGHMAGVNGAGDGLADRVAEAREEAQQREHDRDLLMLRRGHDGHLLADDERAAGERDEDLAHDDEPDAVAGGAEVHHEAGAQDLEGDGGERHIFEGAGGADDEPEDDGEERGADVVRVVDVAGVGEGEVVHGLQVGGEVAVPAVEGDEVDGAEEAAAEEGAVAKL